MATRDEYVEKMKQQLDHWNGEIAAWEAKASQAQHSMRVEYEAQLALLRSRRDEAMDQLRRAQNASLDAWQDLMRGSEEAWKAIGDSFASARSRFDRK